MVPLLLGWVIFIYSFLTWTLSRKVWLTKDSIFENHLIFETWKFWNWHFKKIETLKLWDFELKFGTWNLKFWDLGFWKLRLEILIMKSKVWNFFGSFENWRFWNWILNFWNLRSWKIWNLKFWKIETWDFENLQLEILKLETWNSEFEI